MVTTHSDSDSAGVGDSIATALAIVSELALSTSTDHDQLRRRAVAATERIESARRATRSSKSRLRERQRAVDEWILDIFRATESVLPRESLIDDFIQRWRRERRVADSARHVGPWLFLFAAETDSDGQRRIRTRHAAGVHGEAFDALCKLHLPNAATDPYLGRVLLDGGDIDAWHASWFEPSPLFEGLLNVRGRFSGERNYWVAATPLPGDARHAALGLFLLYPNQGDMLSPEPPSNLRQDQRLLMALSLAWAQLEHRMLRMAQFTEQDRRDVLSSVAPGLLHHELGNYLRTLYGQAFEHFGLLKQAAIADPRPELTLAVKYAHNIGETALGAHKLTHVFNNFERRVAVETASLGAAVEDVLTLLHHRLGNAGTQLLWDHPQFMAVEVKTDIVLLVQALMNIVTNAINAISDGGIPPPRTIRIDLLDGDLDAISLLISNNGPAIDANVRKDLFRLGFTTRTQGHGQGLYLVRRIAHYLGGQVAIMEAEHLPTGMNAGFHFQFKRSLQAEEGLARVDSGSP